MTHDSMTDQISQNPIEITASVPSQNAPVSNEGITAILVLLLCVIFFGLIMSTKVTGPPSVTGIKHPPTPSAIQADEHGNVRRTNVDKAP